MREIKDDLDAELDDSEAAALAERFESEVLTRDDFAERESAAASLTWRQSKAKTLAKI
jgi:hypothetical protein